MVKNLKPIFEKSSVLLIFINDPFVSELGPLIKCNFAIYTIGQGIFDHLQ